MLININDMWDKKTKAAHKAYVEDLVARKHDTIASPILELLVRHCCGDFACGSPEDLRKIMDAASYLCSTETQAAVAAFQAESATFFNYGKFASKRTKGWNAYALCGAANYKICPYCQQSFAVALSSTKSGKSFRPTLDHFYPKSEYPYLGLSLYNLVPSCQTCNSSLKGQINFGDTDHLHPYEDDEHIRFEWDFNDYVASRQGANALSPTKLAVNVITPVRGHAKALHAENSAETFLVRERLTFNLPSLKSFVEVLCSYSSFRIDNVNSAALPSMPLSPETMLQFDPVNYKNEMLGRLKKDLFEARWR